MALSTIIAASAPRSAEHSTRVAPRALDVAGFIGLTALAFAIRWPYLWAVPRFTDEVLEVLHGLAIAQGKSLPLTNYDSYDGAFQNYVFAAVFLLFGQNPWSPRVVSCVAGALTVGLTYLLARDLAVSASCPRPRLAGLLAALMMAFSGVHILVNSHIAWSNSVTPLYTTLGLWLVVRVVRDQATRLLALAGLVFGLALQTHPLAGVLFPAIAGYGLLQVRWLRRSRWLYLGLGLFLLAYSNVIVHNLIDWGDSLEHAQFRRTRENYLVDGPLPETDLVVYARNVPRTAVLLGETLVSSLSPTDRWPAFFDRTLVLTGLVAVFGATLWLAWVGQPLPLLAIGAAGVLLPLANPGRYAPITDGRYVTPLLPLCFAALASMVLTAAWLRSWRTVSMAALLALLVLQPLGPLARYTMGVLAESPSNEALARSVALVLEHRRPGDPVMVDNRLNLGASNIPSPRFARAAFDGLTYLFPFYDVRPIITQVSRGALEDRLQRGPRLFVILPPGYRSELTVGRVTPIRSPSAPLPIDPATTNRPIYEIYLVERRAEGER